MSTQSPALSQGSVGGKWVRIGTLRIQPQLTQETFDGSRAKGAFKAIRLQAKQMPVTFTRVSVVYADGSIEETDNDLSISAGNRTSDLAKRATGQQLNAINFIFEANQNAKEARVVEIWALQDAERSEPRKLPKPSQNIVGTGALLAVIPISFKVDREVVGVGEELGKFRRIRLRARYGEVYVNDAQLTYADGEKSVLPLATSIAENYTDWLEVKEDKFIKDIQLTYRSRPDFTGAAQIEIFGEPSQTSDTTKTYLGGQQQRFMSISRGLGYETDVVSVAQNDGGFEQIELRAKNRAATIHRVEVVYEDGSSEVVVVRQRVPGGGTIGPFNVKSAPIKEISVSYRPRFFMDSQAEGGGLVQFFGMKSADAPTVPKDKCIERTLCTPVNVFFGTNREKSEGPDRIQFSEVSTEALVLGRATVTVPRAFRKKGEIPRPAWRDLLSLKWPTREDPSRHFAIPAGGVTVYSSEDEFLAAAKQSMTEGGRFKDHVFVFVHGYNVSFDNALYRTAQIAYDLGTEDIPFGTAFLYSWPSAGTVEDYAYDLDTARFSVPYMKTFIDMVVDRTGAQHVHLIAHSMGNWPMLNVLEQVARESRRTNITQIILAAPDVNTREFEILTSKILPLGKGMTLYASANDRALLAARKIRKNVARAGDVVASNPLVIQGLDTVDVSSVSTEIFSLNHSTYADKRELLNDMWRLMRNGERPPHLRNLSIQMINRGGKQFWKFAE